MSVLRAFRKRPPYPIPSVARDNLPCIPCVTARGTHPTYYGEFYMMLGPQAVGDPRDNTLPDLIGREWAFLFCDNNEWYLLQWVGAEHLSEAPGLISPGWALIGEPLLSLPGDLACGTQRRFSAAFDQSARLVVAYEQSETIFVTRWDAVLNDYVQNVQFAGVDPCVVFDATWTYDIPLSDVLVFYLDAATRSKLMCRVQRDIYAIAYELHDYGQPVVLDRVTRLPLRYQVLASDAQGVPLEAAGQRVALLSERYPYLSQSRMTGSTLPLAGAHRRGQIFDDALDASTTPLIAAHTRTLETYDADTDGIAATILPLLGVHQDQTPVVIEHEDDDGLAPALLVLSGDHHERLIRTQDDDSMTAALTPLSGVHKED